MNLLLDTQLVLWTAFWPSKIPRQAAQAIKRASSVYISSVSVFTAESKSDRFPCKINACSEKT